MTDTPTSNKRMRKQSLGSNVNTWGDTKLNEVLDVIDQCMDGYESIALTGSLVLATTNYTTSDQAKYRVINLTGSAGAVSVTFPTVQGWYLILNNTNGVVTCLCAAGVGVAIPSGYIALIYGDGTDMHNGAPQFISGALTVAGQIHGLTAGTALTDAVNVTQMQTAISVLAGIIAGGLVLNSLNDPSAGYLSTKVSATGPLTITTINPGTVSEGSRFASSYLGLIDGGILSGASPVASNTRCLYDTTGLAGTATLPANPAAKDIICISKFGLNTLTVNFNGQLFYGVSQNPITTLEGTTMLIFTGATRGWIEIP